MDVIFDTSIFLRLYKIRISRENEPEFDLEAIRKVQETIKNILKVIFRHPKINLLITPIIYSEVACYSYHYCQTSIANEIMVVLEKEGKICLDIDNDSQILDILTNLSRSYQADGGADNLIVSEAKLRNVILVTADEQQSRKARCINVDTYYIFERESFLDLITNTPIK